MVNFSDEGSGIAEYLYSLGTEENPTSVLDHVSSGLEQSMTLPVLRWITEADTYFQKSN